MTIKKALIFFAVLAIALAPGNAEAERRHKAPKRNKPAPSLVDKSAAYADIVIDADTGQILHQVASNEIRHPASLTKMMTLYIVFQALESGYMSLNHYLPVSQNAASQSPTKLGLSPGQRIRVEDALLGVVTGSANDASVVLAEAMGGTVPRFADLMTRQAHALGMTKTRFKNPSGLPDPEQVTTARDMAILGAALISHFPQYYHYFSYDGYTYAGAFRRNHNRLMSRYDGMDGIKTGYIRASGFNLVSSVKRGDKRLVGVVFGGRTAVSRDNQMARILDHSFSVARGLRRVAHVQGEGDGDDFETPDELMLPGKISAAFPLQQAIVADSSAPRARDKSDVVAPRFAAPKNTAPRQTAAEKSKSSAGRGVWGVQVGAFKNKASGHRALEKVVASVPAVPSNPDTRVQRVKSGNSVVYRARLMSLDKQTAQNICAHLSDRGKSCMTVRN